MAPKKGSTWASKMSYEQELASRNEIKRLILWLAGIADNLEWSDVSAHMHAAGIKIIQLKLSLGQATIYEWLRGRYYMPPKHALFFDDLTLGYVRKEIIRPDIFHKIK